MVLPSWYHIVFLVTKANKLTSQTFAHFNLTIDSNASSKTFNLPTFNLPQLEEKPHGTGIS